MSSASKLILCRILLVAARLDKNTYHDVYFHMPSTLLEATFDNWAINAACFSTLLSTWFSMYVNNKIICGWETIFWWGRIQNCVIEYLIINFFVQQALIFLEIMNLSDDRRKYGMLETTYNYINEFSKKYDKYYKSISLLVTMIILNEFYFFNKCSWYLHG